MEERRVRLDIVLVGELCAQMFVASSRQAVCTAQRDGEYECTRTFDTVQRRRLGIKAAHSLGGHDRGQQEVLNLDHLDFANDQSAAQ
jgi:hypothetical protein